MHSKYSLTYLYIYKHSKDGTNICWSSSIFTTCSHLLLDVRHRRHTRTNAQNLTQASQLQTQQSDITTHSQRSPQNCFHDEISSAFYDRVILMKFIWYMQRNILKWCLQPLNMNINSQCTESVAEVVVCTTQGGGLKMRHRRCWERDAIGIKKNMGMWRDITCDPISCVNLQVKQRWSTASSYAHIMFMLAAFFETLSVIGVGVRLAVCLKGAKIEKSPF